jgi:phage recombination protein Bet
METKEIAKQEEKNPKVTYDVAGQEVTLSFRIIKDYLTKGNGAVSDQDLMQFMSVCKFNQLNPFLNEAYLIKFGDKPAQMVVSKEALMKRAEANKEYEGIRAGLILLREGKITEVEGAFYLKDDEILGAWAEVYRKDRKFPIVAKIPLSEYDKNQSTWNEKKATMITKVAKVQALRDAFPAQLGAMYTSEEQGVIDIEATEVTPRKVIDTKITQQEEPTEQKQTAEEVDFDNV